jgi:FkbM family methyltransferase
LSQDILKSFISFYLSFKLTLADYYDPDTYFPKDLADRIDYGHFVDAGAYTGDTLADWIKRYKPQEKGTPYSYYAYEPCLEQFDKLQDYVKTLPADFQKNIKIKKIALGDKEETLTLSGSGPGASLLLTRGPVGIKETVLVKTLDELLSGQSPTFIKADVEGFEIPVLEGARATIMRYRPTLAFSVYHKCSDIWEIPIWVRNLGCDYKLYFRHHLKDYGETVLYAIANK